MLGAKATKQWVRLPVWILAAVLLALLASCGADTFSGDDSETSPATSDEDTTGLNLDSGDDTAAIAELELSAVADALAAGFGRSGAANRSELQRIAADARPCGGIRASERARPTPTQIEIEIVRIAEGCLQFDYEVANFRTLLADLDRFGSPDDVVAVSPLLLEYRLSQRAEPTPGPDEEQADDLTGPSLLRQLDAVSALQPDSAAAGLAIGVSSDAPTGSGVTIAIIDSGIDTAALGLSTASVVRAPDTGAGDYVSTGHGTVAASIVVRPLGESTRALAPDVTLLDVPADLCNDDECGCQPCGAMTPAEAIRWSVDNGADILSMSFGYTPVNQPAWWQVLFDAGRVSSATATLEVALDYAAASDVAMVAAAGNCASPNPTNARCASKDQFEIPAGHPDVIAVGALASTDGETTAAAWYSTRQEYVEIAAPGAVVLTGAESGEIEKIGTSYSTPQVAAAIALLIGDDGPLTNGDVAIDQDIIDQDIIDVARSMLGETAIDLAPTGRDVESGFGQLDIDAALATAATYEPPAQ